MRAARIPWDICTDIANKGVAALILIGAAVFFILRRRRRGEEVAGGQANNATQPTRAQHTGLLPPPMAETAGNTQASTYNQMQNQSSRTAGRASTDHGAVGSAHSAMSVTYRSPSRGTTATSAEGLSSMYASTINPRSTSPNIVGGSHYRSPSALSSEMSMHQAPSTSSYSQPSRVDASGSAAPLRMHVVQEEDRDRKDPFEDNNQVTLGPEGVFVHQDGGGAPDLSQDGRSRGGAGNRRSSPPPYGDRKVHLRPD